MVIGVSMRCSGVSAANGGYGRKRRIYRVIKEHGLLLDRHLGNVRNGGTMTASRSTSLYPVVLGRVRDRLRQRREGAHRLHAGLLRPRGDLLGGDNRRHRQLRQFAT